MRITLLGLHKLASSRVRTHHMPGTMSGGRTTKIKKNPDPSHGKVIDLWGKMGKKLLWYDEQGILIQLCWQWEHGGAAGSLEGKTAKLKTSFEEVMAELSFESWGVAGQAEKRMKQSVGQKLRICLWSPAPTWMLVQYLIVERPWSSFSTSLPLF